MNRRRLSGLLAGSVLVVVTSGVVIWNTVRRAERRASVVTGDRRLVTADALARIDAIPFYRAVLRPEVLRSAAVDGGVLRVDVDVAALLRPRLSPAGLEDLLDLLPRTAHGDLRVGGDDSAAGTVSAESWLLEGPAPLLDVLDRRTARASPSPIWDAVPATPSAIAGAHVVAARLAEPEFGGPALATWRRRVEIAEHVLGRPLRAEIAEDLAGPVLFALYDTTSLGESNALLVVELRRSDRLRALLDTVFALGALTERATVRRYRDVATGSFHSGGQGVGLALAVDGPVLLAASSRFLLEAAIDARHGGRRAGHVVDELRSGRASWGAIATSAFVAHGWARIVRATDPTLAPPPTHAARLTPEGTSSWRLEGRGAGPAITADPVVPFLRSVFGGRQRGAG